MMTCNPESFTLATCYILMLDSGEWFLCLHWKVFWKGQRNLNMNQIFCVLETVRLHHDIQSFLIHGNYPRNILDIWRSEPNGDQRYLEPAGMPGIKEIRT